MVLSLTKSNQICPNLKYFCPNFAQIFQNLINFSPKKFAWECGFISYGTGYYQKLILLLFNVLRIWSFCSIFFIYMTANFSHQKCVSMNNLREASEVPCEKFGPLSCPTKFCAKIKSIRTINGENSQKFIMSYSGNATGNAQNQSGDLQK